MVWIVEWSSRLSSESLMSRSSSEVRPRNTVSGFSLA